MVQDVSSNNTALACQRAEDPVGTAGIVVFKLPELMVFEIPECD